MRLTFFQTSWGSSQGGLEAFVDRVRESGFDGAEVFLPDPDTGIHELVDAAGLELSAHVYSSGSDWREHVRTLQERYLRAIACGPSVVTSQTGHDGFGFADNLRIYEAGEELVRHHGVPIRYETHRGRPTFSLAGTLDLLREIPSMTLTADVSHWMVVHESDLRDRDEQLDVALARTRHLHARVGHEEGPQVPDPRDPAWQSHLERHLELWQRVVDHHARAALERVTITTEFGPPPYLPTTPYAGAPVADQWEINVFVRDWLRDALATSGSAT